VVELSENLKHIISYVRDNIIRAHETNKKYFDATSRDFSFNVGEKVLIRNHELSDGECNRAKKFYKKWLGPFTILKKFGDTYHVEEEDFPINMNLKRHVSDLKPFFERKTSKKLPISLRQAQFDIEPSVSICRQLRAKNKVDYRRLAGVNTYKKSNQFKNQK